MFELLSVIVFVWLLIKAISLALKLTWGMAENHCRYSHRAYPAHADCLSAVCGRRHPDHSRSHDRYSSRNYEVLHQDINTEL